MIGNSTNAQMQLQHVHVLTYNSFVQACVYTIYRYTQHIMYSFTQAIYCFYSMQCRYACDGCGFHKPGICTHTYMSCTHIIYTHNTQVHTHTHTFRIRTPLHTIVTLYYTHVGTHVIAAMRDKQARHLEPSARGNHQSTDLNCAKNVLGKYSV